MPTPRKDVSQLAESTRKRHGKRYKQRGNGPRLQKLLGSAPEHLTAGQKAVWGELMAEVAPGILFTCDRFIVELTVQLTLLMRTGTMTAAQIGQYRGCLASLGITPADRSRIKAPPVTPEKSELDRILDGDDEAFEKQERTLRKERAN